MMFFKDSGVVAFAGRFEIGLHFWKHAHTEMMYERNTDLGHRMISFGLWPLFWFYIKITGGLRYTGAETMHRQVGWQIHSNMIWLWFWSDDYNGGPERKWVFDFQRFFMGECKTHVIDTVRQHGHITMPEAQYPVVFRRQVIHKKWTRMPWRVKRFVRIDASFPVPVPIPGKCDNGWDCDDDAIYETGVWSDDIGMARGIVEDEILSIRAKRASIDWQPE
jgi:hypothetical protein